MVWLKGVRLVNVDKGRVLLRGDFVCHNISGSVFKGERVSKGGWIGFQGSMLSMVNAHYFKYHEDMLVPTI